MKKILFIIFVTLLFLVSCSQFSFYYQTGSSSLTEVSPDSVKIYSSDIEQEYIVIGSVTADVSGGADNAAEYLKRSVAKLGADAIIKVELTKLDSYTSRTGISGVAVKLK